MQAHTDPVQGMPMEQKRPGGEMRSSDPNGPTRSQLLPFGNQWQDITTKPYFLPGLVTALAVALLFGFMGSGTVIRVTYLGLPVGVPVYTFVMSALLVGGGLFAVYRMAGKPKAWWTLPAVAAFSGLLLSAPLMGMLQSVFGIVGNFNPQDSFLVRFIKMLFLAGLPEETFKAVPVAMGVYIGTRLLGRLPATHPARQFAVLEPLDGILIGAAAGFGFAFVETVYQYVPKVILVDQSVMVRLHNLMVQLGLRQIPNPSAYDSLPRLLIDQFIRLANAVGYERAALELQLILRDRLSVGLELMIPRLLGVVTGHAAYAGIFGYFIGLAAMKPAQRVKTVLIGLGIAASLHALWNASDASITSMLLIAFLAFFGLAVTISKARTMSPERSQLVASQLIDRFARTSPVTAAVPPSRPMAQAAPQQQQPQQQQQRPPQQAPAEAVRPVAQPMASMTWDDDSNLRLIEIGSARIPATVGQRLQERQLPGVRALRGDGVVAEVTAHPQDPALLGLKNLSDSPWQLTLADGTERELQPGRSIRLAEGLQVRMGPQTLRVR